MACIVLLVIITMAILFGAELGPQRRPDHHHLHAAARVVLLLPLRAAAGGQAAGAGLPGHDRHPHHLPDPADHPALHRPGAGAPSAAPPDRHDGRRGHHRRDGLPLGARRAGRRAHARSSSATSPQFEEGKEVTASSGCLGCHKIGENGNTLGPPLTNIGDRLGPDAIARTLVNPTAPMPTYDTLRQEHPEQFDQLVAVRRVAEVRAVAPSSGSSGTLPENQVQAMFDRIARVYDRMNSVMTAGLDRRWRQRAADLAGVGGGLDGPRRGHRHRRPGHRAQEPRAPR